jgi:DNA-binding MarR family transcriptional regulator
MDMAQSPSTHVTRLRPETVTAISDVIRDVAVVKRDLQREISTSVPAGAVAVLSVIEREGPMRIGELAEQLCVDLSVASRHASTLEQHALLERVPSLRDRRSHDVSLTAAGSSLLAEVRDAAMGRLADALSEWTDEELREVASTLTRLRNDLSHHRTTL